MNFLASPNFGSRHGKEVSHLIIHAMSGSFGGSKETFLKGTGGNRVSDHYLISKKGEVLQMVHDDMAAWHVGNANSFTIGIEHEDAFFTRLGGGKTKMIKTCLNDSSWMTPAMLMASVKLVSSLIIKHKIPQDKLKERVIGHNSELMRKFGNSHADPGPFFPYEKYYTMIENELRRLSGKNEAKPQEPAENHS